MRVPNTYVIIFSVLLLCAVATWFIPGGVPQTWQVFSALFEGFSQQAGIIAFVLIIGGAFWVVNSTKAVDAGITRFISKASTLERFSLIRKLGIGNIVIVLVMLLFGVFGAVFGMSEETIAFVAVVIPLAKSLSYDEIVGVCMVYVAAHVGFAGAMLNPFTVGIAQEMSGLALFSGIEYRTIFWVVLMAIAIICVLWYASKVKKNRLAAGVCEASGSSEEVQSTEAVEAITETKAGLGAWVSFVAIAVALLLFSIFYASGCVVKIGQGEFAAPWLLWAADALFVLFSLISLLSSTQMYILNLLMFTILFMALGIAAGVAAGNSADNIAKEFIAGAKDIFSAALVIGFAAGIIYILKNGNAIDPLLNSMADSLEGAGKTGALGMMYGIQTFLNLFIPSASAKAAVTMPIMAPFSDMIGLSRQATVLAFQFGDGFTNMITPCSGVLMAVLSVAKIPYAKWFKWAWKFILLLLAVGFLLLLPAALLNLPGF